MVCPRLYEEATILQPHLSHDFDMASSNNNASTPIQQTLLTNASFLDLFFPGLSVISPAFQQLAAGRLNGYTGLLCLCGLLVYLGKYIYGYFRDLVETYFSSLYSSNYLDNR
jgi:mitochondrial chaperone BCS1